MDQIATDQAREQPLTSRRAAIRRFSPAQQRSITAITAGGLLAILALLLLAAIVYTQQYDGRVYRGVSVGGVAVGGLTREAARARLDERAGGYLTAPLGVGTAPKERRWTIAPAELGVTLDTAVAVDVALRYGRDGDPLANAAAWFGALRPFGGHDVAIPATLDDARLDAALRAWAPEATYYPTNATFSVAQGGKLTIVADKNGLGLELDGSRAAFLASAARLSTAPVRLALASVPADIDAQMLREIEGAAREVVARPLTVMAGGRAWTLDAEALGRALGYRRDGDRLVVALDPNGVGPFLDQIAGAVARPGANARLVTDAAGKYQVQPGREGIVLDHTATLAAIDGALTAGRHEAAAVVGPQAPPIVAADLAPVRDYLEWILSKPLVVGFEGATIRTLVRADLQPLIRLAETPDKPEKIAVSLDQTGLRALTQVIAGEVNQPVRDAEFVFANRRVEDKISSQDGREVQFAKTDAALRAAILGATGAMSPDVAVTKPKVASSNKARMYVKDQLGHGRTDYSGSIGPRWHNVELAAERLNGALIAPGAIFSFNARVGEQTIENGYQEAFGIALVPGIGGKPGQVKTVSSVAGGICQVSTTLFQGVFRAGLPIEERNWHLYWVTYAQPAPGLQGLDATVDDQAGLDFKFANITDNWLGIEAVANGGTLTINLFGKDQGWTVDVQQPVITNIRKPEPKPAYEKTHDLPPGTKRYIEHATEGFDATIHRRVIGRDGKVVMYGSTKLDTDFKSSYFPSRDRYQVGVPASEPEGPIEGDELPPQP